MKKGLWAVGLVCAAAAASTARAGFQFNYEVIPGTGALAGNNVFTFYAKNDQTGEQANSHLLLGVSMTMTSSSQPFVFESRDVDGDGLADVDVKGKGISQSNITGTFARIGQYSNWELGVPDRGITPTNPFTKTGGNPGAFASIKTWGLDGVNLAANTNPSELEATTGLGCFFGAAVVPVGSDVTVTGRVAAEKGGVVVGGQASLLAADPLLVDASAPADLAAVAAASGLSVGTYIPFSFVATAPEPATFGLLGVAGIAALRRRRR